MVTEAKRLSLKKWRENNRDKVLQHKKTSYYKNRASNLAKSRAWRVAHKDYMKAYQAQWYLTHKEDVLARVKIWASLHKDLCNVYKKTYRDLHSESISIAASQRYFRHKHLKQIYARQWWRQNREKAVMYRHIRKARQMAAPRNDFTIAQWRAMVRYFRSLCVYCGCKPEKLTQDHVTPILYGGSHTLGNIVPACQSCNSKKGTKAPKEPVQLLLCVS